MITKEIIEQLKAINATLDDVIKSLRMMQEQTLGKIVTDEDIRKYKRLKEVIHVLEEVA